MRKRTAFFKIRAISHYTPAHLCTSHTHSLSLSHTQKETHTLWHRLSWRLWLAAVSNIDLFEMTPQYQHWSPHVDLILFLNEGNLSSYLSSYSLIQLMSRADTHNVLGHMYELTLGKNNSKLRQWRVNEDDGALGFARFAWCSSQRQGKTHREEL